jgi:hypothetical protein
MFTLIRSLRSLRLCWPEAASFIASLFIADRLFHFHSFTLECLAFSVTWFALGALLAWIDERALPIAPRPAVQ